MAVLVVGAESDFDALRPRLFGRRRISPEAAEQVAGALRQANPHADLDALVTGTVLTIPDLEEISLPDELALDDGFGRSFTGMHEAILETITSMADDAASLAADDVAHARHLLDTLRSGAVRKAVVDDQTLAAHVDRAQRSAAAEEGQVKGRLTALGHAREEWTAELDALKGLLP